MPQPTDDGKTYTFKIRDGVKFHDGSPLTAADVAASWQRDHLPADRRIERARSSYYLMVDKVEAPDPSTVVFHLKFATSAFLPALADPFNFIYKKEILDKDPHWYEKNILGSGPSNLPSYRDRPVDQGRAQPRLLPQGAALSRRLHRHFCAESRRSGSTRSARPRRDGVPQHAARRRATSSSRRSATRSRCRRATGTAATLSPRTTRGSRSTMSRVRRALTLAIDRWRGAPALSKIAIVQHRRRHRVPRLAVGGDQGGAAADRRLLARHRKIAGRSQAAVEGGRRRGPQLRAAQPQCRPALQICRDLADRRMEQDRA